MGELDGRAVEVRVSFANVSECPADGFLDGFAFIHCPCSDDWEKRCELLVFCGFVVPCETSE